MPSYQSPETQLPSNVVTLAIPAQQPFLLTAGVSTGLATGYIDQDAAGFIFDIATCGSITPANAPVNGYVVAAMGYLDPGSKSFFLVLVNAPTNLAWRVTFTDNHSVVQSYSSLQGSGSQTSIGGGNFLTTWQFSIPDSYIPMTNGVTYPITVSNFVGPPAALAAGYTVPTFGPEMTLHSNWFPNAFFLPATGGYAQNGDGIYLDGTGNGYGICTAQPGPGRSWTGKAFGGGGYFEAVLSFPPSATSPPSWPAFWSSSIETLAPNAVTSATQWPGQATGYGNWIEPDIFEMDASSASHYGIQMHAWHGTIPGALDLDLQLNSNVNTGAANLNTPNKYGFLWVPATPGVPGSGRAQWFFNDVQVGGTVVWDPYDSSLPPPPVAGASGGSILDKLHLALIANTNTTSPMTIQSVSVWQASDAMNLTSS